MSTLVVTGAGSLAHATLLALSQCPGPIETIAIVARDSERLHWLARTVRARSAVAGHLVDVRSYAIDWDDPRSLASVLTRTKPRVVLHTASWQSAWTLAGADAWSALVRGMGYGVTCSLHLVLAARLGRAVAEHAPAARFVNACFPDAVNPALTRAGIPVVCGIGNVAILAAMLATELPPSQEPLRMVAHHAHVATAISGRPAPVPIRAWRGDTGCDEEVASWLPTARLPADDRLNEITGAASVPLLHALAEPTDVYRGHAPGPAGLYGGYPITVAESAVALDLPRHVSLEDAEAHNRAASVGDGLAVDAAGRVSWSSHASAALDAAGPAARNTLLGIFDDTDVEASARRVRDLRERLVTQLP